MNIYQLLILKTIINFIPKMAYLDADKCVFCLRYPAKGAILASMKC